MKRSVLLAALLLLAGHHLVRGQGSQSLSLEVQPVSAGATLQNTASTSTSSSGSSYSSGNLNVTSAQEALQIKLRNLGPTPSSAKVQWYFVAAPVVPEPGKPSEDQEFVFDQGAQDVTVAGGATQELNAVSTEVTSTKKTSGGRGGSSSRRSSSFSTNRASTKPKETGSKLRGWLVRATVDGKVVAARGSTQTYEDIAQDDESMKDLLDGEPPQTARAHKSKKPTAGAKAQTTATTH